MTETSVDHRHAKLPALLRYRGLESEAVRVARVVKVETLIRTLRTVLSDLRASIGDSLCSGRSEVQAGKAAIERSEPYDEATVFASRHVQLVERILEDALSRLRTEATDVGP